MAIIRGTDFSETLRGTAGADTMLGFEGSDLLFGRSGSDRLFGGSQGDVLRGELGDDALFGQGGRDFLVGGRGEDRVDGGDGNDTLRDVADGPDGNDVYDGGAGDDALSYLDTRVGVTIIFGDGGADGQARQGAETDVVRNVETVVGSAVADRMIGNDLDNEFLGAGGSDRLEGRGGDDTLVLNGRPGAGPTTADGGTGSDFIGGGASADRLFGGTGADRIFTGDDAVDGRRRPADAVDLGADGDADTLVAHVVDIPEIDLFSGIDVDLVSRFRAQDLLDVEVDRGGFFPSVEASDHLDSDGSGRIDAADADVRQVGQDLVLDVDAMFARVTGDDLGLGDQHLVLRHVTSFDADQLV